jgi:hypothetical protein
MSTLVTTNLKHGGASGNNIVLNSDGTFNLGSAKFETPSGSAPIYSCRAWVNFNGTGSVAIRASGNVSSITDNGTGDYTVNFTTAMPDANYAVVTGASSNSDPAAGAGFNMTTRSPSTNTTTSTRLVAGVNNAFYDLHVCHVSIFR